MLPDCGDQIWKPERGMRIRERPEERAPRFILLEP